MNILIIYGGKSCEHEISLITACLSKGYFEGDIYSCYVDKQNQFYLVSNSLTPSKHLNTKHKKEICFCFGKKSIVIRKGKRTSKEIPIDVAVNCCHGVNGEDGSVAGICQMAGIPLVGSNIFASSVAMDKYYCKRMLKIMGFSVVEGKLVTKQEFSKEKISLGRLHFPLIVKPCKLGSSIGISLCKTTEQLKDALELAFSFDERVLLENALEDFYEVNCAAMRVAGEIETSNVDCPITSGDILSFEDKYTSGTKWQKPSVGVPKEIVAVVKDMTKNVYQKLSFEGVIRVDFLVDKQGDVFINEINTIPGSLSYGLWQGVYTQKQFGKVLAQQAIDEYNKKESLTYNFESSVLNGAINKK